MHGPLAKLHSQADSATGKAELASVSVPRPLVAPLNEWPCQAPRTVPTNNNGPVGAVACGVTWGG